MSEELADTSALLAGVDGCPAGWLAIWSRAGTVEAQVEAQVFETIEALFCELEEAHVIAIDMPIGLLEHGRRRCDQLARSALGDRRSSVFPAPIRALLEAEDYDHACRLARELDGAARGISLQTWNILPKIRALDEALRANPDRRQRAYEVHPELSFMALNQGEPMAHSKHRPAGRQRREQLVDEQFGDLRASLRERWRVRDVSHDDLHDALALLWSAARIEKGCARSLPAQPVCDGVGLPMRIVY